MNILELPKPTPLFEVPPELVAAIEANAPPDKSCVLPYPYLDLSTKKYHASVSNQELWTAGLEYASYLVKQAPELMGTEVLMLTRTLTAGPHMPFVVVDDPRGWHTDLGNHVSVASGVSTEFLVGTVDRQKAAKDLGDIMLLDDPRHGQTYQDQIACLNAYDAISEIPGELTIFRPELLHATLVSSAHAHRRPPRNPHNHTTTRTFVNTTRFPTATDC